MIFRLVLACILLTLISPYVQAADVFVAPNGSDSNPGTKSQPFATLARARDEIRSRIVQHSNRNYTVAFRGGKYRLNQTVVFDLRDSASAGHSITYEAYRDEKPVFTSAIPVTRWVREGKLWTAPVPSGLKTFRTLYDAQGRLPRSRGPGFLPTQDYQAADKLDRFTLPYPPGAVRNWSNIDDIELMIRPNFGWMLDILPFESVDEANHLARTSVPASYAMVKVRYAPSRITTNGTAWIENAVDYLDAPGEWTVDSHQGKIYLLPRSGEKPEGIESPTVTELIRVEGQINYDGPKDEPVRGLVFRGLSFTGGDRFSWERNRVGYTLQHDWEMFDRPTALVRLRGAEGIRFEKCRMVDSGGAGLRMDLHCQSNRVSSCEFGHLGGTGILLAGYGPGTKDVNRHNTIERNHIHDIGELIWHASGIACFQSSENLISHNLLHDLPYTAIVVSGRISWNREGKGDGWGTIRWKEIEALNRPELLPSPGHRPTWKEREPFLHGRNNLIEQNEIHDVMHKLWDGDGIYVSGTAVAIVSGKTSSTTACPKTCVKASAAMTTRKKLSSNATSSCAVVASVPASRSRA